MGLELNIGIYIEILALHVYANLEFSFFEKQGVLWLLSSSK